MEYQDKVLKCAECDAEFVFTAGEQMFFADKGFKNEPKRCKNCKAKRTESPGQTQGNNFQRTETKTTCSQCGKETTVPFKPTQGRPVYCRECFQQRRTIGSPGRLTRKTPDRGAADPKPSKSVSIRRNSGSGVLARKPRCPTAQPLPIPIQA